MRNRILSSTIFIFLVLILVGNANATNISVNQTAGIQNTINNASDRDTLNLTAGTYYEYGLQLTRI